MQSSLHLNIYALYLIKLAKWFMLIMPVAVLFYADNNLNELDIYLLQALYSLSVAVMEIPSGYMADIIGRKKSLVMGSILGTAGFALYALSQSFSGFLVAEITLGLGGSFISGSDSALLYDTLAAEGEEQHYLRYEGRITAMGNFAETIAAVGGGLIAAFLSYRGVYLAQTFIAAIAIPASLSLMEPPRERLGTKPGIRQILDIGHHGLVRNKQLSSAIIFSSVIGAATLCMAWTAQVYFVHKGLDERAITPLWVLLNLLVAVTAAYTVKIKDRFGTRWLYLLLILMIPMGYILLGALPLVPAILALFVFYGVRGYATPLLKDLINQNCPSHIRATILSIRSLIIRVGFSVVGPLIGLFSAQYSLLTALVAAGGVFACLVVSAGWYLKNQVPELFSRH